MAGLDPSMLASMGSLGSGAADFGMGNITSIFNFIQGLKGAHHKRMVGDKMDMRRQARLSGDPDWYKMSVASSPNADMQAVLADLLPFGIGRNVGQFAYPTSPEDRSQTPAPTSNTPTRR